MNPSPLLVVISLVVVFSLTACHRKAATPASPAPTMSTENPRPNDNGNSPTMEPKQEGYQVVGYQKTACFGKCPVYQVKFFSEGKVMWYGQLNVERKGWYEATVSKELLKEIRDKAHAAHFWDFAPSYPNGGYKVPDLPSTVTYIRAGDMEKAVINTHQAPAELEVFEDYLEGVINGLNWKPSATK